MQIKKVDSEKIRNLRHRVLRKGKPYSTTKYLKDESEKTFHLACIVNKKIKSCATFYPEETKLCKAKKAYRLRGMATDEKYRKRGFGKKILEEAFKEIKKQEGDLLWCNARLAAVEFYKKMGLKAIGEEFNISDIGPHYIMYKKI